MRVVQSQKRGLVEPCELRAVMLPRVGSMLEGGVLEKRYEARLGSLAVDADTPEEAIDALRERLEG